MCREYIAVYLIGDWSHEKRCTKRDNIEFTCHASPYVIPTVRIYFLSVVNVWMKHLNLEICFCWQSVIEFHCGVGVFRCSVRREHVSTCYPNCFGNKSEIHSRCNWNLNQEHMLSSLIRHRTMLKSINDNVSRQPMEYISAAISNRISVWIYESYLVYFSNVQYRLSSLLTLPGASQLPKHPVTLFDGNIH